MLKRFFDLREEVRIFLERKEHPMPELDDEEWLCEFAFLVDITTHLNELNTKLQKKGQYAHELFAHVRAFQNKLRLWIAQIQGGELAHFQTLRASGMIPNKVEYFCEQIQSLSDDFSARFQDFKAHEKYFQIFATPFHADVDSAPPEIQMELIELQERAYLKTKFNDEADIGAFYRANLDGFPNLKKFVASKMALFGSTYLAEQFFSKMGFMKSPHRASIIDVHLEQGLRLASSSIQPDFERVTHKVQFQPSH
jgi:hypothetical protein